MTVRESELFTGTCTSTCNCSVHTPHRTACQCCADILQYVVGLVVLDTSLHRLISLTMWGKVSVQTTCTCTTVDADFS